MSSASSRGGGIKSIQRGVYTHSGSGSEENVTVSAVVTGKSYLNLLTSSAGATTRIRLVNSTNVGVTSNAAVGVSWELVENY